MTFDSLVFWQWNKCMLGSDARFGISKVLCDSMDGYWVSLLYGGSCKTVTRILIAHDNPTAYEKWTCSDSHMWSPGKH